MNPRVLVALMAASALAACGAAPGDDVEISTTSDRFIRSSMPVGGQYIVVMEDLGLEAEALEYEIDDMARAHQADVFVRFKSALRGFAARMTERQAIALSRDPRIAFVEEDGKVHAIVTQSNATWGLDRIDQRALPLSTTYTYNVNGAGVHAYIVDTGISATHTEFTGRMGNGYTAISDGTGTGDCNGHGTHVAGTVGGTVYGVAKGVTLHPVRVLDCAGSGANSGVIAGVDWVRTNGVQPAVANMSLGGSASSAVDTAVVNAINSGITFVLAAGNDNADACNYSPARTPAAITVGNTTSTDARSTSSNYGTCLDIFAPGTSITSASHTSTTGTAVKSGTSMASPHVAGAAALYLATNTGASPATVRDALVNNATPNVVTSPGTGSPNRLLYTGFIGSGTGDTTPPTTSITAPAAGATLTGAVTIAASASDNIGVTRVEFYVDGATRIGTATTSPYSVSWNSAAVANGTHTLTSKAFDAAGNVGTSADVAVTTSNTTTTCTTATQLFANPGFESGNVSWTASAGVINNTTTYAARTGAWKAWLGGNGRTITESAYQQVTIPSAACTAQLAFWLRIDSAETTTSTVYDRLQVQILNSAGTVLATLATYSNLNESTSYAQKTFDLAAYKGQTIRVRFYSTEDYSLQTSFLVDDTALNVTQ